MGETSVSNSINGNGLVVIPRDRGGASSQEKSSRLVQTLGPSSYITKRTEVSWLPRNLQSDDSELASEVLITTELDIDQLSTPPTSPGNQYVRTPLSLVATNMTRSLPVTFDGVDSPVNLNPNVKSPAQPESNTWSLSFKPNNPDAWRPPDEWDCRPLEPRMATAQLENLVNGSFPSDPREDPSEECFDLSTLQYEVERMALASPDVVLSRLKEAGDANADPSLHQEFEMEKKRWMLSVLHHLDPLPQNDTTRPLTGKSTSTGTQKILALWESQGMGVE